MISFSMGNSPRPLRRPVLRPAQRVILLSSQDESIATAQGKGVITIQVSQPANHAGEYRLDTALLAHGPVCLVPPAALVAADGSGVVATAGLWACDPELGTVQLAGQWLADGQAVAAASGLALAADAALAGLSLCYAETARQGLRETAMSSQAVSLPKAEDTELPADPEPEQSQPQPAPNPAGMSVVYLTDGPDTGTAVVDADPTQPLTLVLEPPHIHAGTYTITPAMMEDMAAGPICLVPPAIEIDGDLTAYTVTRIGLWVCNADRGPMAVTRSWRRAGINITPAQTGMSLPFLSTYRTVAITNVETAIQGVLVRPQVSNAVTVPADLVPQDVFTAEVDTLLDNWVGASGEAWTKIYDLTGATGTDIFIRGDRLQDGRPSGDIYARGALDRGPRQFAEAPYHSGTSTAARGHAIGVCMSGRAGYILAHQTTDSNTAPTYPGKYILYRYSSGGTATTLAEWNADVPTNADRSHRLEVDLTSGQPVLSAYADGVLLGTYTDASASALSGGGVGVRPVVQTSALALNNGKLKGFHGGTL